MLSSRVNDLEPMLQRALSVEEDDEARDRIENSLERIRCHPAAAADERRAGGSGVSIECAARG